jgi:hypothetical protein
VSSASEILADPPDGDNVTLDQDVGVVLAGWPGADHAASAAWVLDAVATCRDPSAFEQIVEMLAEHGHVSDDLGVRLVDALLARARPAQDSASAYVAAVAVEDAAARLLAEDLDGRRLDLVTRLRDGAAADTDAAWAQAVARTAGLLYAHWRDASLRGPLRAVVHQLGAHPEAGGDAGTEDAHIALLDALEATELEAAHDGLADAERRFSDLATEDEERVDAAFYASVVRAVRAFGLGGDPSVVAEAAASARDIGSERALYGRSDALPLFSRRSAEAMWGRLTETLATLSNDLDEPVWIHGARTVSLMAEAIQASRCVSVAPGRAGSADPIVIPRIESRLARGLEQRRILELVLLRDEIAPELRDEASALLTSVSVPPKADGPEDALENVIGADTAQQIADAIGPEAAQRLRDQLAQASRGRERDSQWHGTYKSLLASLDGHPDFVAPHRVKLEAIVADLLDFYTFCTRYQLNFADGLLAYLGKADAKEAAMADHLVMYLQMAGWSVQSEVPNEGSGGRVDVRVSLNASDRFVIECKRDKQPVAATTIDPYLAQTDRYLTTSVRIGALAILDLSDKSTGSVRGLDTSVWINDVPAADPVGPARKVVTVVVPGNRAATPSTVGKATAR